MQIFRYMVYIWERYERQMEQKQPSCMKRKDFSYPPIIPIVYDEGKDKNVIKVLKRQLYR